MLDSCVHEGQNYGVQNYGCPGYLISTVAIDTGKSGTLSLSSHFIGGNSLRDRFQHLRTTENRRICGNSPEDEVLADSIHIGGQQQTDVAIRLRIPGTEAAESETVLDGVLGRQLLIQKRLLIDFPNAVSALSPLERDDP